MSPSSVVFVVLGCIASGVAAQERAHVIVMKDLSEFPVVEGKAFNVTYEVHNRGDTVGINIEIVDSWPEETFELIEGEITANIDKLLPGANTSHWFTLKPRDGTEGEFIARSASVEYSWMEYDEEADAEDTMTATAKSSALGKFPIVSAAQHLRETSQYLEEWGVFGGFSSLAIAMPFMVWVNKKGDFHNSGKRK